MPIAAMLFFRWDRYRPVELVRSEPAANRTLVTGEPLEELVIVHGRKVYDCLLAGTAKAALLFGGHLVPAFGTGGVNAEADGSLHRGLFTSGCAGVPVYISWQDLFSICGYISKLSNYMDNGMNTGNNFLKLYEQFGVFSYEEDGFVVQMLQGAKKYLYSGIEAIIAYKVDLLTYDEIRLEVIFEECVLRISEDAPGWYQFVIKMKEVFPSIPKDWDLRMPFPPWAMNLMVLYRKD